VTDKFEKKREEAKKKRKLVGGEDSKSDEALDKTKAFGIFSTNALPCGPPADLGIFVLAARLNHSCDHNVRHMWDEALQRLVVLSLIPSFFPILFLSALLSLL